LRTILVFLAVSASLAASPAVVKHATSLYERTDYEAAIGVLKEDPAPDAGTYSLIGRSYFMLGEFKKATNSLEKAVAGSPNNSEYVHWLGRAYGRRAETSGPLTAPFNAVKARQYFEKAVQLDPHNKEALNDLFDYYLQAPVFLGGGIDKAEDVAKRIGEIDPAEYHYAQAQLADKKKDRSAAEDQLRRAMAMAPKQVGRVIDLARYLAKQGKVQESDALFQRAEAISPDNPRLLYERAKIYIETQRNLPEARTLLKKYLQCNLTPDDPSKESAEKLLQKAMGA